ncbi:hypothetical protein [Chryseobacterium sp. BIGb0232]|nr:hypothetical protein [Chryseobacterium sp. BIGb0232]MCS4304118.1 hypothetical protein [Chryseobacterium sp. BIGb0232]ROS17697.1 hypothetical protein EDF65_2078 [Chryseobacterium nakagawai]
MTGSRKLGVIKVFELDQEQKLEVKSRAKAIIDKANFFIHL